MPLVLFFIIFFFSACQNDEVLTMPEKSNFYDLNPYKEPLEYLNYIRIKSNMIAFKRNSLLDKSAQNHALYSVKHRHIGHSEDLSKEGFSGKDPSQRAFFVGYETSISENIAYKNNYKAAIDSLFTAIYHRFGFLSFTQDEIGFSLQKNENFSNIVFNMGNSILQNACKDGGHSGYGSFYTKVCKDEKIKIKKDFYEKASDFLNDDIVVFPYKSAKNVDISFSGEIPNPMPECKITANPVSIQFNPNQKPIKMKSFKIYENDKELKNVKILNKNNDINLKFTDKQFAIFSLNVFKFNTKYKAVFDYIQDGKSKKISWDFTTTSPKNPYFIVKGGENLAINENTDYDIFFLTQNCNDKIDFYKVNSPSSSKITLNEINANHIRINIKGYKNTQVTLKANNKEIKLILQNSSYMQNNKKYILMAILLFILAILVAFYRAIKPKNSN